MSPDDLSKLLTDRLKIILGDLVMNNAQLTVENEMLKAQISKQKDG